MLVYAISFVLPSWLAVKLASVSMQLHMCCKQAQFSPALWTQVCLLSKLESTMARVVNQASARSAGLV